MMMMMIAVMIVTMIVMVIVVVIVVMTVVLHHGLPSIFCIDYPRAANISTPVLRGYMVR